MYLIQGRRYCPDDEGFADALAAAHGAHHRPLCLCLVRGIEMYVARLSDSFIVKRMPYTGSHHTPDCPSYEPPAELSGLGQVLGSAITEDPVNGVTALKLGFSMSKMGARTIDPGSGDGSDSVATDGTKLSLRGLLHYLWDQAELTHWHPGFAGKRSWATVRKYLLMAAENKIARGAALQSRLYVPEVFTVEHRDEINARRMAQLLNATAKPTGARPLMLLIGEVKEIVPARYGFKAVIKHVPDQPFALDEQLYRRMGRRFERELSLWGTSDAVHMMLIATFGLNEAGVPTIEELSLMPVTGQWLPIEDSFEQQLVERMVRDCRTFVKALRYNLPVGQLLASAILTDTAESPVAICIARGGANDEQVADVLKDLGTVNGSPAWVWWVAQGTIPPLPRQSRPLPVVGRVSAVHGRNASPGMLETNDHQ